MNMQRLIRKAVWSWQSWRFDRRMKRDHPEWYAARKRRAKAQKRHGKVKPIDAQLVRHCHAELRGNVR